MLNKCVYVLLVMKITNKNMTIRLEGECVILGYDNIASCMTSNQSFIKVNCQLVVTLAAEGLGEVVG